MGADLRMHLPLECASARQRRTVGSHLAPAATHNAPVAQPDRVVASEAIGRGFESLRARHLRCRFVVIAGLRAGREGVRCRARQWRAGAASHPSGRAIFRCRFVAIAGLRAGRQGVRCRARRWRAGAASHPSGRAIFRCRFVAIAGLRAARQGVRCRARRWRAGTASHPSGRAIFRYRFVVIAGLRAARQGVRCRARQWRAGAASHPSGRAIFRCRFVAIAGLRAGRQGVRCRARRWRAARVITCWRPCWKCPRVPQELLNATFPAPLSLPVFTRRTQHERNGKSVVAHRMP